MDEDELNDISAAIRSGAAICLLGAGFARMAQDAHGQQVPTTEELTSELKSSLQIDEKENVSLSDIADFADEQPAGRNKLRAILMERLTLCKPNELQTSFLREPWRAIFTTNFDDIVEQSSSAGRFAPVTPASNASAIPGIKTPIYYMHGRARDLVETDADPALVISETNYLQMDRKNRDLYARFFNEIFCARLLVIVGYSLKDLEIAQGLLSRSAALREKTVIICHPDDGRVARARLEKFGRVLPIGLDGITSALGAAAAAPLVASQTFQFLEEVNLGADSTPINNDDFVKLILLGQVDYDKYVQQVRGNDENQFCVDRSNAVDVVSTVRMRMHAALLLAQISEMGNRYFSCSWPFERSNAAIESRLLALAWQKYSLK